MTEQERQRQMSVVITPKEILNRSLLSLSLSLLCFSASSSVSFPLLYLPLRTDEVNRAKSPLIECVTDQRQPKEHVGGSDGSIIRDATGK